MVEQAICDTQSNANVVGELTCVVVDELHMVCDIHRGLPLELSITKLLFSRYADCIQLIGMSATMGGEQVYVMASRPALIQLCCWPLLSCLCLSCPFLAFTLAFTSHALSCSCVLDSALLCFVLP